MAQFTFLQPPPPQKIKETRVLSEIFQNRGTFWTEHLQVWLKHADFKTWSFLMFGCKSSLPQVCHNLRQPAICAYQLDM